MRQTRENAKDGLVRYLKIEKITTISYTYVLLRLWLRCMYVTTYVCITVYVRYYLVREEKR